MMLSSQAPRRETLDAHMSGQPPHTPTRRRRWSAARRRSLSHLRHQQHGFGLVELLIAMTVLTIGIFALIAAFTGASGAQLRAARKSTAQTLTEKQLELYRAVLWNNIGLESSLVASAASDTVHASDIACGASCNAAPTGTQTVSATCTTSTPECKPIQAPVTGPDGRSYRIDTYISTVTPSGAGATVGRAVKEITVVVRSYTNQSAPPLARFVSIFDQSTGCTGTAQNPC